MEKKRKRKSNQRLVPLQFFFSFSVSKNHRASPSHNIWNYNYTNQESPHDNYKTKINT